MEYKGFRIMRIKPLKKTSYRIYKDDKFLQSSSSLKNAKRLIDSGVFR